MQVENRGRNGGGKTGKNGRSPIKGLPILSSFLIKLAGFNLSAARCHVGVNVSNGVSIYKDPRLRGFLSGSDITCRSESSSASTEASSAPDILSLFDIQIMNSIVCRSRLRQVSSRLTRLLSSLAVLEQKDGKLLAGSLGAVTAAQKLGGSITGFLAGSNIGSAAESAARARGVDKVIKVDNVAYDKVSCSAPWFSFTHH